MRTPYTGLDEFSEALAYSDVRFGGGFHRLRMTDSGRTLPSRSTLEMSAIAKADVQLPLGNFSSRHIAAIQERFTKRQKFLLTEVFARELLTVTN